MGFKELHSLQATDTRDSNYYFYCLPFLRHVVKHQTSDMIAVRAKTEPSSFKNLFKKTFQCHKQVNDKIKLQCSSLMMSSDDHQQVLGQEFKML